MLHNCLSFFIDLFISDKCHIWFLLSLSCPPPPFVLVFVSHPAVLEAIQGGLGGHLGTGD